MVLLLMYQLKTLIMKFGCQMKKFHDFSEEEQNLVNKPGSCRVYGGGHDSWYLTSLGCGNCGDISPEVFNDKELNVKQVVTPFGEVTVRSKF